MITQKRIHELFEYREDGNLISKNTRGGNAKAGMVAGCLQPSGYIRLRIDGTDRQLHRMIFLYHHGQIAEGMEIDHIDGDKANNRIENLRQVTKSQNNQNAKIRSDNTSGTKGVYKQRNKWISQITINKKQLYLGSYNTLEQAEMVVKEAREKYHGEYARHE